MFIRFIIIQYFWSLYFTKRANAVPISGNLSVPLQVSSEINQLISSIPKPHRNSYEPPQYMLDLYNQIVNSDGKSFLPYGATMARGLLEKDGFKSRFTFLLSGIPSDENFLEAEFQFHHHQLPAEERKILGRNKLYQIEVEVPEVQKNLSDIPPQVVSSHVSGRSIFKVGSTVRKLKALGHISIDFIVRAKSLEGNPLLFKLQHGIRGAKAPLLILFSKSSDISSTDVLLQTKIERKRLPSSRVKRSLHDNVIEETINTHAIGSEDTELSECHLTTLYIDFKNIGWNWIVYPVGYSANQCTGTCSIPFEDHDHDPTNHAVIRSIFLNHTSGNIVEPPSCVPSSYDDLTLLYYSEDNVILKKFNHMIARTCGCR